MIRFACPNCETALKAANDRAGQKISCPECQRRVAVPENLDEQPAAERDTSRRIPLWIWAVGPPALVALVIAIVVVVSSGPKDGLTRAERAQLEVNLRSSLPGVWDVVTPGGSSYWSGVYDFKEDGRFRAFEMRGGEQVTKWVGTWSVSGSTLSIKITEFVHAEALDRAIAHRVVDVRSEGGRIFQFSAAYSTGEGKHLTFTKKPEPAPASKLDPPLQQTANPPKRGDGLTGDQRLAKWLIGRWSSQGADGTWEWEFFLPLETSGLYSVKVFNAGQEVGRFDGQWFIAAGQLTLKVGVSFYEPMPANSAHTFEIFTPGPDSFTLRTPLKEYVTTLTRRK